jgi:hypothetical protein
MNSSHGYVYIFHIYKKTNKNLQLWRLDTFFNIQYDNSAIYCYQFYVFKHFKILIIPVRRNRT